MTCIFIKPLFISLLLLEEDQSCSSSSNVCLESKRAKREKSAMYRILSNVTGKRKDFPRITNSDPIGKHEVCDCWGKVFIERMWFTQIKNKCKLYASITTVAVMFGK